MLKLSNRLHKNFSTWLNLCVIQKTLFSKEYIYIVEHERVISLSWGELPRDIRFGPKVGQFGHIWDKSGIFFSDQNQYILAR